MEINGKVIKPNISELHEQFSKLDFGTVVTTSDFETIEVSVDPNFMLGDYAKAMARDLQRRNPLRFDSVITTLPDGFDGMEDALNYYVIGLLKYRIQAVHDICSVWRQIKRLVIPPYIQFALSMIGKVTDVDHGRKFVPKIDEVEDVDLHVMLQISETISIFQLDGVSLLTDAFPRSQEGDKETMSYAIIDGYVKGIERSEVAKSYIAVFLGLKLKKETEFRAIYSVRYDNAEYVRDCLIDELLRIK